MWIGSCESCDAKLKATGGGVIIRRMRNVFAHSFAKHALSVGAEPKLRLNEIKIIRTYVQRS